MKSTCKCTKKGLSEMKKYDNVIKWIMCESVVIIYIYIGFHFYMNCKYEMLIEGPFDVGCVN